MPVKYWGYLAVAIVAEVIATSGVLERRPDDVLQVGAFGRLRK